MTKMNFFIIFFSIFSTTQQGVSRKYFIPFGKSAGDQIMHIIDDGFIGPINISTEFPFFDSNYNSLFVNTNGLISFVIGISNNYAPFIFPSNNSNYTCVSPFWTDFNTLKGGDIFFRETKNINILKIISSDIQKLISTHIVLSWAFVATWVDVVHYNSDCGTIKNTFQVVIATNDLNSFALFYYETVCYNMAKVGYNAGDGNNFYFLNVDQVSKITTSSNIGIPGKWILRIDSLPTINSCSIYNDSIQLRPKKLFISGGEEVNVTGICVKKNDKIKIYFNSEIEVDCSYINRTRCVFITPFLKNVTVINVKIEINGNISYLTQITSYDLGLKQNMFGIKKYYESNTTEEIKIEWKHPKTSTFNLYLIEIFENTSIVSLLKQNISKNYAYIDSSELFKNSEEYPKFCYLTLHDLSKDSNRIWSNQFQVYLIYNITNSNETCESWSQNQSDLSQFINQLPTCWKFIPTQLNHSIPFIFGYFKMDEICNPFHSSGCDLFYSGANVCYKSITNYGLENISILKKCCYDKENKLIVGYPGGGRLEYDDFNLKLQNFKTNVEPFLICCKLSNNCSKFYDKRSSDNGKNWQPWFAASANTHFITFDKVQYTFNAIGEFTLFEIEEMNFTVQIRVLPYSNSLPLFKKTSGFRAIAIRGGFQTDIIQFEFNSTDQIKMFINSKSVNIDDYKMDEPKFMNDYFLTISERSIVLNYLIGVEIQILVNKLFSVFIKISDKYFAKTRGLLGNFNMNKNDEFIFKNGTILSIDSENDSDIFRLYRNAWLNNASSSIFFDRNNISNFSNENFSPSFISDEFSNLDLDEIRKLTNLKQYIFDIITTHDLIRANLTLETFSKMKEFSNLIKKQINEVCPPLQIRNGNSNTKYLENHGLSYLFSCDENFILDGPTNLSCSEMINYSESRFCFMPTTTTTTTASTTTTTTTKSTTTPTTTTKTTDTTINTTSTSFVVSTNVYNDSNYNISSINTTKYKDENFFSYLNLTIANKPSSNAENEKITRDISFNKIFLFLLILGFLSLSAIMAFFIYSKTKKLPNEVRKIDESVNLDDINS